MSRRAVVFSGVGYTKDKPLLYYATDLLASQGYELSYVDFSGIPWSKEQLKDPKHFKEILGECLKRAENVLADVDLDGAESVLFVSKSIGTVVATAYAKMKSLDAKQILLTPLEAIRNFVEEENGLVFYGNADPFAEADVIAQICKEKHLEAHCLENTNHSLETGDVMTNIENLKRVMQIIEDLVAQKSIY